MVLGFFNTNTGQLLRDNWVFFRICQFFWIMIQVRSIYGRNVTFASLNSARHEVMDRNALLREILSFVDKCHWHLTEMWSLTEMLLLTEMQVFTELRSLMEKTIIDQKTIIDRNAVMDKKTRSFFEKLPLKMASLMNWVKYYNI